MVLLTASSLLEKEESQTLADFAFDLSVKAP